MSVSWHSAQRRLSFPYERKFNTFQAFTLCDVAMPLRKNGISQNYVPACTTGTQHVLEVSSVHGSTQHLNSGLVSLATTNSDNSVLCRVPSLRPRRRRPRMLQPNPKLFYDPWTPAPWYYGRTPRIAPTLSQHWCNGQRANLLCSGWRRVLWCIINERIEWNVGEEVCYLIFHCARSKINGRWHWCSAVPLQAGRVPSSTGILNRAVRKLLAHEKSMMLHSTFWMTSCPLQVTLSIF